MKGETTAPQLRLVDRNGATLSDLQLAQARHPSNSGRAPRMRLVTGSDNDGVGWISLTERNGPPLAVARAQAQPEAAIEYDGFGPLDPGEPDDPDYLGTLARGVAEHGEAFSFWAQLTGTTEGLQRFDAAYLGCTPNQELWHEHLADALGVTDQLAAIRPDLQAFVQIDFRGWAKRLAESGTVTVADGSEGRHIYFAEEAL